MEEFSNKTVGRLGRPKKYQRPAGCHPDREDYVRGLCEECYTRTPHKVVKRIVPEETKEKVKVAHKKYTTSTVGRQVTLKATLKRYGLSVDKYNGMYYNQNGCCAICGVEMDCSPGVNKNRRISVDHCHTTGIVRGLLCHKCNMGLGHFNDNVDLLRRAIDYLNQKQE